MINHRVIIPKKPNGMESVFFLKLCVIFPSPGILDTLAEEEESNSENEDDFVDIDLVALQVAA